MSKESLEKRIAFLEKELERLWAVQEVQKLVGKYAVYHTPKSFSRSLELFALKQPDVSVQIAMWGVWIGPEQVKTMFEKILVEPLVGTMFEHQFTTPMIEIARDGQTARGLWFSPGHETPLKGGKLQANWCWGKYAADFIKEDGEWKIWHWLFYDTFMCPYEKSWVEAEQPPVDVDLSVWSENIPPGLRKYPPDKPTPIRTSYYPTGSREPYPACPEPYDTWKT